MIPPAPLIPVPVISEPYEHVIVDCVGPLPKAKDANQFLLTVMCTSTRNPEAILLRKITARAVFKALTKFFTTFGLLNVILTSKLCAQVLNHLILHIAYPVLITWRVRGHGKGSVKH